MGERCTLVTLEIDNARDGVRIKYVYDYLIFVCFLQVYMTLNI